MRARGAAAAVCGVALAFAAPSRAKADPKWSAGVETGVCGRGSSLGLAGPAWCNALRADVLFLRKRSGDVGLGPALRLGSAGFDDLRLDAGLSLLLPVFEAFPLELQAGPHLRNLDEPGIYGSLFFGIRSFNHYGSYEMSGGLALVAERTFVTGTPSALWIAARLDAAWLAMPFIFLYNAAR